jgi:hypothetical protein
MALTSPGVELSVVDESFYTPAEPGTRPLLLVATASNKPNAAGTGIAPGTLASNADRVFVINSQRELVETFGDPVFRVDSNNNPIHGSELNEYGLQAAYSFLGVSNSALILRADIDLADLNPTPAAPGGEPVDGTFWLDVGTSQFGVFQWNGQPNTVRGGQTFTARTPIVITEQSRLTALGSPKTSVGIIGDYAIAPGTDTLSEDEINDNVPNVGQATSHVLTLWYKNDSNNWVVVGSEDWKDSWPVAASSVVTSTSLVGSFRVNSQEITGASVSQLAASINANGVLNAAGVRADVVNSSLRVFSRGADVNFSAVTGDGAVDSQTLLTTLGFRTDITYRTVALATQPHTQIPEWRSRDSVARPTGAVWIKTTEPNAGARWRLKKYNGDTNQWTPVEVGFYPNSHSALAALDQAGGGLNLPVDRAFIHYNFTGDSANPIAEFRVMRRSRIGVTKIRTREITNNNPVPAGTYTFVIQESMLGSATLNSKGVQVVVPGGSIGLDEIADAISAAQLTNVVADVVGNRVEISHQRGGEIVFVEVDGSSSFIGSILGIADTQNNTNVYAYGDGAGTVVASNWIPLTITPDTSTLTRQSYFIQSNTPNTLVPDGKLWYSSIVDQVDIMIHNGQTWVGYKNYADTVDTNATGPIVSATAPQTQTDGTALSDGDLWINTSDLENYPAIYRFNALSQTWNEIDKSDQTTDQGIVFADARWATDGSSDQPSSIEELLTSNFLDFDAPDPSLYPRGILLWNLRRSGFNVKKFVKNYIDLTDDNLRFNTSQSLVGQRPTSGQSMEFYYPHRWVTESGNQADGSGSFGRKAQRKVVQQALQKAANSNQDIRDTERFNYNLLACPGYPELIGEMISINYDRGLTSFVVGDTPSRLPADSTTLNEWGTNLRGALEDSDQGLVSSDEYLGVFYPWGFTSDNAGRDIVVPPSHMILRMMALNDQVAYPWFAPAGTRRGGITNATAVGFIDAEGEFKTVALNQGQRDTLYNLKINPISFFVGSGLVNFGQKTRARNDSALDRINVSRLVIYLRSQLNRLAKPYIFEPNDKITRDEIKAQVESLLLELVGLRAIYDFLVVCDESNNTPSRIDRNELYVDVAIEPVKAIEFIYIPLRIKNTGELSGS